MQQLDVFSDRYAELLDDSYDCVDRIVLNGYIPYLQSGGGFRCWWRKVYGHDDNLDNAHLMRWAGRFARRVRYAAKANNTPLLEKCRDDRMHQIVQEFRPSDLHFQGVFAISVHRAPNSVWGVVECSNNEIHLERKSPQPWVNHYAFHILDADWGHITIKVCPHPPFHVQVTLNGHDFVAQQAASEGIPFTKEQNCFTDSSNLAGLEKIAETLCSPSAIGRLIQVCERWLYSACLCYLLPVAEHQPLGVKYEWSTYQLEYSRNLLFANGGVMEEIFQSVIDRTRAVLDVRTIRTLFGFKQRPFFRRDGQPNFEVVVERPTYDLIVFKVHCGLLTLKIYTKGERVLRIEAIVHNAKKEFARGGYGIAHFPKIAGALRSMVVRFLEVLRSVEACWVTDETLESLPEPSQVGASRIAGVDLNRVRMRAVVTAVLALSSQVRGFRVEHLATRVGEILDQPYTARQASYDLKKLRAKGLVKKLPGTRRYECPLEGLRTILAVVVLREKVIKPILAGTVTRRDASPTPSPDPLDHHYQTLRDQMRQLLQQAGIAA